MSHNRFIQSFTQIPKDIFRVNSGISIRLRAWPGPTRPHGMFDLLTTAGKVQPKALDPASYECMLMVVKIIPPMPLIYLSP